MTKTLIRGGWVLTMGRSNLVDADVLVDGDRIAEIGAGLRARDAEVVDATGSIVMPGFVDTHRHAWESLFRNLGSDAASPDRYGPHFGPDDVYAATLVGLLGAAEAGITSVVDWCGLAVAGHGEAALQAHADAGVRSVLVYGQEPWAEGDWAGGIRSFSSSTTGDLQMLAAGPSDATPGRIEDVAEGWALARDLGMRIHSHAGSTPERAGEIAAMGENGLLGADVTLVHCSCLSDDDLDAVASSGTGVSVAPSSEMAGPLGFPPLQRLLDRGIRPGFGVDVEVLAPGDMFAQMRAAISLQHMTHFELKLSGKAGLPRLLTTREVIKFATVDGARAAGIADVGVLEPGRMADIVVLRADRPNIHPVNDPIGAVVWGMDTSNVDWVFVAGRPVKRDGEMTGDVASARSLAIEAQRRVAGASGMLATAGEAS